MSRLGGSGHDGGPGALTPGLAVRLRELVERLPGARMIVLGDVVADEYIFGEPVRLSREAPIPVLEFRGRQVRPGGGTNAAANARSLGARVSVVGVVGDDDMGRELRRSLEADGIDVGGIAVDPRRATCVKTRIVAGDTQVFHQQVARIDRVDYSAMEDGVNEELWHSLDARLPDADSLLIADYEAGVINPALLRTLLPRARERGILIAVDAHDALFRFRGISVATPNQPEAALAAGFPIDGAESLERAGRDLLARMEAEAVLITRGSDGIALFERGGATTHIPSLLFRDVRDPTGAGDTVAAAFALARAVGASFIEAAYLASLAAGVVIGKLAVATCNPSELREAIDLWHARAQW